VDECESLRTGFGPWWWADAVVYAVQTLGFCGCEAGAYTRPLFGLT